MKRDQRGIQSLEAGGRLLVALGLSPSPMALKDLAREGGMTPSKAHPYLVSFGKLGLVEQDATTGRYDLGEATLRLGLTALQRLDPLKIAGAELERLPVDAHYSIALAVWGNLGPTIVRFIEADYPLQVFLRSGTVLSLGNTAAGRVFSAYMPRATIQAALRHEPYRFFAGPQPLTLARLDRLTQEVRELGIGRSVGTTVSGVNSICAPVFDHRGTLVLTISVMRPGLPPDAEPDGELATTARLCAERVSRRLGHGA